MFKNLRKNIGQHGEHFLCKKTNLFFKRSNDNGLGDLKFYVFLCFLRLFSVNTNIDMVHTFGLIFKNSQYNLLWHGTTPSYSSFCLQT